MKLSYDPQNNLAYITLRDKTEPVEMLQISKELRVEIGADGKVYGMVLLNASHQLQDTFTIVNEVTGSSLGIRLEW